MKLKVRAYSFSIFAHNPSYRKADLSPRLYYQGRLGTLSLGIINIVFHLPETV
jgi:hypothetical protein